MIDATQFIAALAELLHELERMNNSDNVDKQKAYDIAAQGILDTLAKFPPIILITVASA